jgi:hypothetical protein
VVSKPAPVAVEPKTMPETPTAGLAVPREPQAVSNPAPATFEEIAAIYRRVVEKIQTAQKAQ